jgi:chitin synthase
MNWLLPGNFYLAFFFLTSPDGGGPFSGVPAIATALNLVYLFLTMSQFILGLGNTPDEMKQMYLFSCLFYGMFSYLIFVLSTVYVLTNNTSVLGLPPYIIKVASAATTGCYFVAAAFHGELGAIASSFMQYIFMMPTFFNIFSIYSFCNIHDISWGTKGIDTNDGHGAKAVGGGGGKKGGLQTSQSAVIDADQQLANQQHAELLLHRQKREHEAKAKETREVEKEFKAFRSSLLLTWMMSNALFVYIIASKVVSQNTYLPFLFLVALVFTGMRFMGSCYFLLARYCWLGYRKIQKEKEQVKVRKQQHHLQRMHRNGGFQDEIDDQHAADPTRQEAEFV